MPFVQPHRALGVTLQNVSCLGPPTIMISSTRHSAEEDENVALQNAAGAAVVPTLVERRSAAQKGVVLAIHFTDAAWD